MKSRPGIHNPLIAAVVSMAVALGLPWPVGATDIGEVHLMALSRDRAILRIDGNRRVLSVGETSPEGVMLVAADTTRAIVRIGEVDEELRPGMFVLPETHRDDIAGGRETVTLYADSSGFFFADGTINGQSVRFLVDTGASSIAISSELAGRLGIDFSDAEAGMASTASGIVRIHHVRIARVSVGNITLHDVPAGVLEGAFPRLPLLGMSFLGQLDMRRDGDRMQLLSR